MKAKFIAIANKGTEYLYKVSSMIAVPKNSAQWIADVLTKQRYQLKENEVWHVYDNDYYSDSMIAKEIRKANKGKLRVYAYYGG